MHDIVEVLQHVGRKTEGPVHDFTSRIFVELRHRLGDPRRQDSQNWQNETSQVGTPETANLQVSRQAFLHDQDPEPTFVAQAILMGIATAAAFRSGSELTGYGQR